MMLFLFVLSLRWTSSNLGFKAVPESQTLPSWARHGLVVKRSQALCLRDLCLNPSPITCWPAHGCGHQTVETALWGLKGKINVKHGTEQNRKQMEIFLLHEFVGDWVQPNKLWYSLSSYAPGVRNNLGAVTLGPPFHCSGKGRPGGELLVLLPASPLWPWFSEANVGVKMINLPFQKAWRLELDLKNIIFRLYS